MEDLGGQISANPQLFSNIIGSQRVTQYLCIAGLTLWFWDILITFDEEVELIWRRKRSTIRFLYIFNRYFPAASLSLTAYGTRSQIGPLSDYGCQVLMTSIIVLQLVLVIIAPTIFVMRVYTISSMQPKIRGLLVTITACANIFLLAFIATALKRFFPTIGFDSTLQMCLARSNVVMFGAMYYVPVGIDTAVFLTTIYHAVMFSSLRKHLSQTAASMILHKLYIDGVLYYLIVLTIRVMACVLFYDSISTRGYTLSFLDNALTSTVTTRFVLSFRRTVVNSLGMEGSNLSHHHTQGASKQTATFGSTPIEMGKLGGKRGTIKVYQRSRGSAALVDANPSDRSDGFHEKDNGDIEIISPNSIQSVPDPPRRRYSGLSSSSSFAAGSLGSTTPEEGVDADGNKIKWQTSSQEHINLESDIHNLVPSLHYTPFDTPSYPNARMRHHHSHSNPNPDPHSLPHFRTRSLGSLAPFHPTFTSPTLHEHSDYRLPAFGAGQRSLESQSLQQPQLSPFEQPLASSQPQPSHTPIMTSAFQTPQASPTLSFDNAKSQSHGSELRTWKTPPHRFDGTHP